MGDRSDDWEWIRHEAIIRDEYTCQECGSKGGRKGDAKLEVHHKTPIGDGGDDTLDNLITLCNPCHKKAHGGVESPKEHIMEAMNPCEPYTAGDLSNLTEIPRRTADYHLRNLAEEGRIKRKKHSARRVTYWIEEA